MALTRRKLLNAMARLGGAAAVYETLAAWDFLKASPACARPMSSTAPATIARSSKLRAAPAGAV